ncbi:Glycosyltransferase involved in cell wall bisynthesis [Frankineae bacterium MT45]|nr:Glycosyltransferase involved in cell wall bisynthesis [Frankineae bacterium MT45]
MTLRIAIVKPDWGITGGFELLADELARRLQASGHEIRWMSPSVADLDPRPYELNVDGIAAQAPDYLRFVQLVEAFGSLDLHRADLVISTQPPSYAIDHPRHIAVFSHHYRSFYDLSDTMIEAGMIKDVAAHRHAELLVRQIDARYLTPIPRILATSAEVKRRIGDFNGLHENVGVFHAGLGFQGTFPQPRSSDTFDYALCVSRHEFPKRTELFVSAMSQAPEVDAIAVGRGGRSGYTIELAEQLRAGERDTGDDRSLWCNEVPFIDPGELPRTVGRLRFSGFVTADELDELYRGALCVVAPAFLEDYGLTAIEAMAYGKPLIVCSDGGNLVNFVTDEVNGLIVEPTGAAIAAAVRRLADDRDLARRLGAAARELAQEFTWENAMKTFEAAMEEVLAG